MLKLLLGHWQTHREPLPFVLTDDPLYCSHLTKTPFPEVYSVNRVNPIFEEPEEDLGLKSLKRSVSENDTGYSSSTQSKQGVQGCMTSDSDSDSQQLDQVIVSVDVHRESSPDDVIVLPPESPVSTFSDHSSAYNSTDSNRSDEGSSDISSLNHDSSKITAMAKNANQMVRDKLQKLLEKGNGQSDETTTHPKVLDVPTSDITKKELMKSLNRVLNTKVPKTEEEAVTRTDSALDNHSTSVDSTSSASSTSQKMLKLKPTNGVTRQDESSTSSSVSVTKLKRPRNNKDTKKDSSQESSSDSKTFVPHGSHKCKVCENAHRPLAFHQLLPGHWSYDNVYLPRMAHPMYCSCVHPQQKHFTSSSRPSTSEDDVFYPLYFPHQNLARARHSWAENTIQNNPKRRKFSSTENGLNKRSSPDGTSRGTDSSPSDSLQKSVPERMSLREPKKCKCDQCLDSVLDKPHLTCPCHCLANHRKVKFASDTDLSQHRHIQPLTLSKEVKKLASGEPISAAFVMNLPHLNGHAISASQGHKENGVKGKSAGLPRGLKEPIKMDELYRSYPINFSEWESQYRRNYLQKRRKRALTMVGMAIGIMLVVGISVALTFVFLRIRRTT